MKLFIALGIARDGFLMCLQLLRSEQLEEDFRMKSLFLKNFKFLSIFFPFYKLFLSLLLHHITNYSHLDSSLFTLRGSKGIRVFRVKKEMREDITLIICKLRQLCNENFFTQ